jgi:hypothetical protein
MRVVTDFRRLNLLLKRTMSLISYYKDWVHDQFNERIYLWFSIGLKYGLLSHQTRCWRSKAMYNCILIAHRKIQIQTLTHGYQDCLVPDVFQNVLSKLVQDMQYVKSYLDALLILTNRNNSFKDHLLKLETVLSRLSIAGMRVNISKSKFFSEQIEYLGYWILDHQTRCSTYT